MAEATHTSEALYGLRIGRGRGHRLWAGNIQVTDAETIDTGLDTIEAAVTTIVEATAPTSALLVVEVKSVSAGTITFVSRTVTLTEATDGSRVLGAATDTNAFLIVVGTSRGL